MVGGRVDVQHQRNVVDVDAAGGDVGGDQDRRVAVLEVGQDAVALALGLAAVQRRRVHALLTQPLGEPVHVGLGAHEHDRAALAGADLRDDGLLVRVRNLEQVVVHGGHAGRRRRDRVRHRVGEVLPDQLVDVAVERRGEQQPLPARRGQVEDLADLRHEAHVRHLVGLVQRGEHHLAQLAGALPDVVGQPAGGGDEQVHAAGQLVGLLGEGRPADHDPAPQAE